MSEAEGRRLQAQEGRRRWRRTTRGRVGEEKSEETSRPASGEEPR